MTREQYERMCHAAHNLLALDREGRDVDPLSVEWARWVVASHYTGPPAPVAHQRAKIIEAMRNHPTEGMTAQQVFEAATGLSKKICAVTLSYMVKHGQAAMYKIPGRSRYFADETALAQGRALVEAAEQRRAAAKANPPAKAKPIKRVPVKPKPRPRTTTPRAASSWRGRKGQAAALHEQGVYVAATLPENVRIQELPCGRDMRLVPEPPIRGIGAGDEWIKLTSPQRRRRR